MTEAARAGRSFWDAWGRLPPGYERRLQEIAGQGTYWHLFCAGERVNGGLAPDRAGAAEESRRLAWAHHYSPGRLPAADLAGGWERWDG